MTFLLLLFLGDIYLSLDYSDTKPFYIFDGNLKTWLYEDSEICISMVKSGVFMFLFSVILFLAKGYGLKYNLQWSLKTEG